MGLTLSKKNILLYKIDLFTFNITKSITKIITVNENKAFKKF